MRPWLRTTLIVVAAILLLWGAYSAFALYSNGNDVNVELHVGTQGTGATTMYLRCAAITGSGASCDKADQTTITVHKRDRVHFTIVDDEGGSHKHDFRILGWQYVLPPNRPETELNDARETLAMTAWATGSFHILCELPGHEAAGMQGTLVVA